VAIRTRQGWLPEERRDICFPIVGSLRQLKFSGWQVRKLAIRTRQSWLPRERRDICFPIVGSPRQLKFLGWQ